MDQGRQRNVWRNRVIICILAYLCLLSFCHLLRMRDGRFHFYGVGEPGFNVGVWLLYGADVYLLFKMIERRDRRLHMVGGLGGLLLSIAMVYGTYAHFCNDIFMDSSTMILQGGLILGLLPMTFPLSEEVLLFFEKMQRKCQPEQTREKASRCFLIAWVVIFIAYLPLFLANWPGNFVFDGVYQIGEVLNDSYSTHHPLLHTLLMGTAYKMGLAWGNVSAGYQCYTIVQMLCLSAAFAYLVSFLYQKGSPRVLWLGALLWFAFFPMHGLFAISSTKDVLFAAFFLVFMIQLTKVLQMGEHVGGWNLAGLCVSGILLMLFRNNGMYAVVAGGILIALGFGLPRKERLRLLILILLMWIGYRGCEAGLVAATHAQSKDTYRETLCVPLQCLARVAAYRGDELDEALYQEICIYIRESDLAQYNPYNADAVKNYANEEALRGNLINFLKLWGKVGLQFPGEYVESMITNTLGYWYPGERGVYAEADISLYHKLIGTEHEIEKASYCRWVEKPYNYLFFLGKYRETPLLGYSFRTDPYVWFLIFLILWAIYQKDRRAGAMTVIPFLYLGTCFLGPMAALRYLYCIIVCVPLMIDSILKQRTMTP